MKMKSVEWNKERDEKCKSWMMIKKNLKKNDDGRVLEKKIPQQYSLFLDFFFRDFIFKKTSLF